VLQSRAAPEKLIARSLKKVTTPEPDQQTILDYLKVRL
jgi:hypothetical protein